MTVFEEADRMAVAIHSNKIRDLERRILRLEEEMDIARKLIGESLKLHLNEERPQA